MVKHNDPPTETRTIDQIKKGTPTSRRRLIQAAGAGIAGAAVLTSPGSAQESPDRLEIVSTGDSPVDYSFTCTGTITLLENRGFASAESDQEEVVENDDGTQTLTGRLEPGYGDAFELEGDVTDFRPVEGEYRLYLNGQQVTREELVTAETHELVITTPEDGSVEYTMTTTGPISKDLDNGDNSAEESNDTVVENDDGTWTVTGLTGNGYGDTFLFEGEATAFEPKSGEFSLSLDGQSVTAYELLGEEPPFHKLEIVTPEDGSVEYEFTADGKITKDLDNGDNSAEESNDTVVQNSDGTWTATGLTGNGYGDTYEIEGEVISFVADSGEFGLYLDDEQVTVSELTVDDSDSTGDSTTDDSDETTDDGSDDSDDTTDDLVMGGGTGYGAIVARSDADYVVRSADGLADALGSASSGDIVFVVGDADIDTGDRGFDVPAGVTLASNRGRDGAPGALLRTDETPQVLLRPQANARVTGLRLRGPTPGEIVTHNDGISFDTPTYAMHLEGGDVEVDNCEVWGWPDRAVSVQHAGAHVHHNYIYDNNGQGLGYGVAAADECLIEYNYFHNNRHSVTCAYDAPGYTARHNHFSPVSVLHICDVHDPVQGDTTIESNVIENGESRTWDNPAAEGVAGYSGGFDGGSLTVLDNWFFDEASAYLDGVDDSGNVYGDEDSRNPTDIIPNHPGLDDRPWL